MAIVRSLALALAFVLLAIAVPQAAFSSSSSDAPQRAFDQSHILECLMEHPHAVADPVGLAFGWPERTFDVAVAVDAAFVGVYGADWETDARAMIDRVSAFYEEQIGLTINVVDIHSHAASVFPGSTTSQLLVNAKNHYDAAHAGLARENVHVFTGKELSGAVGQANCIGGAGDPDVAYTVGTTVGLDVIEFLGLTWFPDAYTKIAAHEMLHILSAHHHYSNCAQTALHYDPTVTFDACTIMINDIGLASWDLDPVNRLSTRGWADAADL